MKRREMLRASTTGKAFLKTLLKIMVKKTRIIEEKDKAVQTAVQAKVLELAAKGVALEAKKQPDDVVREIKGFGRKMDNLSRNVRKNIRISLDTNRQVAGDLAATDHDNEGEFKPDLKGKDDEKLLIEAWEAVHPDDKKGQRQRICLTIYKKAHPNSTTKDKAFKTFYQAIMYQLRRETGYYQS